MQVQVDDALVVDRSTLTSMIPRSHWIVGLRAFVVHMAFKLKSADRVFHFCLENLVFDLVLKILLI